MNLCGTCRKDFATVKAFDAHRVGSLDYSYSEGVKMEPMREDGRRCLSTDELAEAGFVLGQDGSWRQR